ncbi:hypothetical protein D9613_005988 [Agrocybe pediades]|uniref:Protein-tyrosine-phosphatase n=1 Tax=Agrocybe pediades TaxID=84607 RepID=A0A8H4QWH7_9AGAR|nr:hypothetical protein D9613_005988 [Agrocybe pediades]
MDQDQVQAAIQGPVDVEWRYEMRRECQEILPGLLLGPFVASKSLDTLLNLGVTHMCKMIFTMLAVVGIRLTRLLSVCIRDAKEAFSVKPRFPDRFQYKVLDVEDNEEQNLIRLFPEAKTFIDQAIDQGGRVLVHCNGGISLSPAFVVMFVMERCQLSWEDALHFVQNRRYCISPNGGFLAQIKEYEAIYKANIAHAAFPPTAPRIIARRKREDDDDEEEERNEDRKRPLMDDNADDDAMQL